MTTESPQAPVAAGRERRPRPPRRWPFGHDATGVMAAIAVVIALIYGVTLVNRQAEIYEEAGAAAFEAASGATMAQILVILGLAGAGAAYRRGFPMRWVYAAAGVAALLAVVFSLLPHLAAGHSWLTTLLGFIVAIVFDIVLAVELLVATAYVPLWWERR
jgi:hypothetical protein